MSSSKRSKRIELWRRCQQHVGKLAILFTIAAIIALAWSLFMGPGQPGSSNWTLDTTASGTDSGSGSGTIPAKSPGSATGGSVNPGTDSSAGAKSSGSKPASGAEQPPAGETAPGQAVPGQTASTLPRASSADEIPVYIVGAVARPGVYIVRRNSYLYELVEKAGGLRDDAASLVINLALKLSENQMVRIPTEAEASDPLNPNPYPSAPSAVNRKTININTAAAAELETLPGIGPATAAAIIADRTKNGPFKQPEDIMRVAGVKESRYEQLEPLISVR